MRLKRLYRFNEEVDSFLFMSSRFCAYCFILISEKEKFVALDFDEKRSVTFHDSWFLSSWHIISSYHEFCKKCTLIRKACIVLRTNQYSVIDSDMF